MNKNKNKDKKEDSSNLQLKEVYKVWGPAEAEIIKGFLESHGIHCVFRGKVVQSVHPFSTDGLGEIKIFVREEDLPLAKKLIASLRPKK